MNCPTCDHMMYMIDSDACPWMFWCPGCGTLKSELLGNGKVHTPKLVERCRRLLFAGPDAPTGTALGEAGH